MTVSILTDTSDVFTTTSQRYSQEMRSTTDLSSAELVVQSEASIVQHHSLQYSIQYGSNFIIWFVKLLQWIDYFNQDSLMWSSAFHNLHAKKPSRFYMSLGLCGKPYHQETHQHSRIGYIGMIFSEVIIAVVSSAKFNESDHSDLCQRHQWTLWIIKQKGSFRSAPNNKESIYFKRHAQENETVSDLSTYELVVQIVVSAVSDHVPEHQNPHKNFSSTQKSIFWFARSLQWSCHSNQRSDLLQNHRNQVKYCYEDTPSAFTGWKQVSNATELDRRKLQRPGQRPGFTKDIDMIFFLLILPPTCPNIYLYGNGISISTPSGHHGQGHHNNLAPADDVKTGPLIKSMETINSTDQGTHEDQEDIALSQPERPDYIREDLKDQTSGSFNFHTIVLAENRLARTIMQSQHMMLSSGLSNLEQPVRKDPPAMQEKMLTKLQTSTPTSQPGTRKPPGLFNMSKPVRPDPQRDSPTQVFTVKSKEAQEALANTGHRVLLTPKPVAALRLREFLPRSAETSTQARVKTVRINGEQSTFVKMQTPLPRECRGPSTAGTTTLRSLHVRLSYTIVMNTCCIYCICITRILRSIFAEFNSLVSGLQPSTRE